MNTTRERRRLRNRSKIFGTKARPRLSVFRSNRHMYGQLIDDGTGRTLVSASTHEFKRDGKKIEQAGRVGKLLAERAKQAGISEAVMNKGSYQYHGRVQAVADGARQGGLKL